MSGRHTMSAVCDLDIALAFKKSSVVIGLVINQARIRLLLERAELFNAELRLLQSHLQDVFGSERERVRAGNAHLCFAVRIAAFKNVDFFGSVHVFADVMIYGQDFDVHHVFSICWSTRCFLCRFLFCCHVFGLLSI